MAVFCLVLKLSDEECFVDGVDYRLCSTICVGWEIRPTLCGRGYVLDVGVGLFSVMDV